MNNVVFDRRRLLQLCSSLSTWIAAQSSRTPAAAQTRNAAPAKVKARKPYIAIQVPPFCWKDEGVEKVLDIIQEKAHVNTIWAYTYTYEHRRLTAAQLPDHGKAAFEADYNGGSFCDYDPKYFRNTILDDFRAPDYDGINVIAEVLPKAKARGMDFICWDYNNAFPTLPRRMKNASKVMEVDVYGMRRNSACFNNEDFRNHLYGKIENYLKTYPQIYGIAWGCEREGPLGNTLLRDRTTCFCRDCQAKGRERGISVERARQGYLGLIGLLAAARKDQRPNDGYFVEFWRLLLEYPEILAWEKLWTDSYHEVRGQLYGIAKGIAPEKPFGWHIWHNATFDPFYRAEENYAESRHYADFFKPAIYNNSGGPRMAEFLDRWCATIFHDAKPADLTPLYYKIMNYAHEAPHDKLYTSGLSADYVYQETKRIMATVDKAASVFPGIDIDVPTREAQKRTTPDDVLKSVKAAFSAGADGVVLSRRYSEMHLANLAAAGQAMKEAGVV
jgi:hypothetical protein